MILRHTSTNTKKRAGTKQTAVELEVDEYAVIKTLVFEDESKKPFITLMHGNKEVSTKELARTLGVKKIDPASAQNALKATGYQFGGTSPFGTKTKLKIYVESSILDLDKIYINGGKRGFIVGINPQDLKKAFDINLVNVGNEK